jgi:hypothetical protein
LVYTGTEGLTDRYHGKNLPKFNPGVAPDNMSPFYQEKWTALPCPGVIYVYFILSLTGMYVPGMYVPGMYT